MKFEVGDIVRVRGARFSTTYLVEYVEGTVVEGLVCNEHGIPLRGMVTGRLTFHAPELVLVKRLPSWAR